MLAKIDSLKGFIGGVGASYGWEYSNSLANRLFDDANSLRALGDSIKGWIGGGGASFTWEYTNSLANLLWDAANSIKAKADSLRNRVGLAGATEGGEETNSIANVTWDNANSIKAKIDSARVDISGITGTGTGLYACTLKVYDSTNETFVSGLYVTVQNASGDDQGHGKTGVAGYLIVNLDTSSVYSVLIGMNQGYVQTTNPQPLTVTGNMTDTILVTPYSVSVCQVYGTVINQQGNYARGAYVTAKLVSDTDSLYYGTSNVDGMEFRTRVDNVGGYSFNLIPNSLLSDTTSTYLISIKSASGYVILAPKYVTVPNSPGWRLQ